MLHVCWIYVAYVVAYMFAAAADSCATSMWSRACKIRHGPQRAVLSALTIVLLLYFAVYVAEAALCILATPLLGTSEVDDGTSVPLDFGPASPVVNLVPLQACLYASPYMWVWATCSGLPGGTDIFWTARWH